MMFDFHRSFADFIKKYMQAEKLSAEDVEDVISELSAEWSLLPVAALGGKSPAEYIGGITDPAELIEMLRAQAESGLLPQLEDRIVELDGTAPLLAALLRDSSSAAIKRSALKFLAEKGELIPSVADMLPRLGEDAVYEYYSKLLTARPAETVDVLLAAGKAGYDERALLAADILSRAPQSDAVYAFLSETFQTFSDIPLTAPMLARYGDPRAVELLTAAADDCNYFEFIELRSAIEALGGDLAISRDWSDDEYYNRLTNPDE